MAQLQEPFRHKSAATLERISRLASRAAGVFLLLGACGALSILVGVVPSGNYQDVPLVNAGLQLAGVALACGALAVVGAVLYFTIVMSGSESTRVVALGGLLQMAIGGWLALFVLRTPLTGRGAPGLALMAACAIAFLTAGSTTLAAMWIRFKPLAADTSRSEPQVPDGD
jgi:hypothetical protein